MATPFQIFRANRNGSSTNHYVPPGGKKINVETVVEMLVSLSETGHIGPRRAANALLEAMSDAPWRISASRHKGGFGGKDYAPDMNDHITIQVRGHRQNQYHLQVTREGHIRRLTGDRNAEKIEPWLSPGTPIK